MPVTFAAYAPQWRAACLGIFDANTPEFFAPDERRDYEAFLDRVPAGYEVCMDGACVVGAFGLMERDGAACSLNWVLIAPQAQGRGIGTALMRRAAATARAASITRVLIAASHRSAPFFARFGAVPISRIEDGWGAGMHRVDMEWSPVDQPDAPMFAPVR